VSEEHPIIILRREPGPIPGTNLVTFDVPGLRQGQVVVSNVFEGQQEELTAIRAMLGQHQNAEKVLGETAI
jgi:hypothetical protein